MNKGLFGTDGIRGIANEYPITPEVMLNVGRAIVSAIQTDSDKKRIVIGKDTRVSCGMIESAIASGICSMNGDAYLAGVMPTPGIAFLTASGVFDAGVVISASHNPYYDNGIKIFNNKGFKLSDEMEKQIELKVIDYISSANNLKYNGIGNVKVVENPDLNYLNFLKQTLASGDSLNGLKIVLDCSNGATSYIAPKFFKQIGADVETLFASPDGENINDKCGSQHTEILQKIVLEKHADLGLAFDGDGDRLIAVDENGQTITGDQILAVCAKYLKEQGKLSNNTVVSTVMSNVGLRQAFKKLDINLAITDVGDRYVLEQMIKTNAIIGGEDSGHMIFLDHHTSGDGIFTGFRLIQVMQDTGQRLSDLVKIMKVFPQVLMNIKVREKINIDRISEITDAIKKVESRLKDQGRVLVRYSGTQPICRVMVEGPDKTDTRRYCQDIADVISAKIGIKKQD